MLKKEYQELKNQVLSFIESDFVEEQFSSLEKIENEIVDQELKQHDYSKKLCTLIDKMDAFKFENKIPYQEEYQTPEQKKLMQPLLEEEKNLDNEYQVNDFINTDILSNYKLNNRYNTCYNITYQFLHEVFKVDIEKLNSLEKYEQRDEILKPILQTLQDFIKYDAGARGENILNNLPYNLQFEILYDNGFIIDNRRSYNVKLFSYMFWLCGVKHEKSFKTVLSLSDFKNLYKEQREIEKQIKELSLRSQQLLRESDVIAIATYDKYKMVRGFENIEYLYSFKKDFNVE